MEKHPHLTLRQKQILSGTGLALFAILLALVCWYAGKPLVAFVREPERFRAWVDQRGAAAPILFVGMVVLQVVVAIIPGEPLEIAAGYAFGAVEGTLLCLAGIFIGSALIFLLVRRFGTRAIEVFFPLENLKPLQRLQKSKRRLHFWVFLLMFLPGTPKDLLSYFVGLTRMPLLNWLVITTVARIPSVLTSTIGGNALGSEKYIFALIVFAATLAVSALGILIYKKVCSGRE